MTQSDKVYATEKNYVYGILIHFFNFINTFHICSYFSFFTRIFAVIIGSCPGFPSHPYRCTTVYILNYTYQMIFGFLSRQPDRETQQSVDQALYKALTSYK